MDRIDLERHLEERDIEGELVFTGTSVHTAQAAAEVMDVDPSRIVKSLVFIIDSGPVLMIVPGNEEVDVEKVKETTGAEECRLAESDEVKDATGYSVGEVPPIGIEAPVIIDKSVMGKEKVYAGGGSDRYLLKIAPQEIKENTDGRVENVLKL